MNIKKRILPVRNKVWRRFTNETSLFLRVLADLNISSLKIGIVSLALVMLLSPITAFAESAVPHTINLQSMVFDAEGKVTTSESVDMTIRILDADNNVLFSEAQNDVVVVKGAINVNIGESVGGIPLDILDPSTGMKLIDVEIAGQSPFELMPLGALPYSMWAEKALTVSNDSIGTEQIKNGSIKAEDIDPLDFSAIQGIAGEGQIPTSMATDAELGAHATSTTAHPASAIVVSGSFVTFVATNVQEALQKLDAKLVDEIVNRQNGQATLTANVTALQTATSNINNIPGTLGESKIDPLIARDSEVASAIASHNHDAAYVNVTGDTMTGQLTVTQDPASTASANASVRINPATSAADEKLLAIQDNGADVFTVDKEGDVTVSGTVDGVDVSALSSSVTTISTDVSGKVSKIGDTMTGELQVPDQAVGPVLDGSNFNVGRTLRDHRNRIAALEAGPEPVGYFREYFDGTTNSSSAATLYTTTIPANTMLRVTAYATIVATDGSVHRSLQEDGYFLRIATIDNGDHDTNHSVQVGGGGPNVQWQCEDNSNCGASNVVALRTGASGSTLVRYRGYIEGSFVSMP